MRKLLCLAASGAVLTLAACNQASSPNANTAKTSVTTSEVTSPKTNTAPTQQEAKEFLEAAEKEVSELSNYGARVAWVNANFVTDDTDWLVSQVGAEGAKLTTRLANEAKRFNDLTLPPDMDRKMEGLKRGSEFPAPEKLGAAEELSKIMTSLSSKYSKGKFKINIDNPKFIEILDVSGKPNPNGKGEIPDGTLEQETKDGKITLGQASQLIAKLRDPKLLNEIWEGWRTVVNLSDEEIEENKTLKDDEKRTPMKSNYVRMVEIINEGSNELGFADAGALWRSGYDMPADDFTKEADRLWGQVKPLYDELHCYVRAGLNKEYGDEVVPIDQPIRADLLGNMWAQSWGNIYDLVAPEGVEEGVDITELLEEANYTELQMVEAGEKFFTSLGFEPLPQTFWDRSLFLEPKDREVECHASAWNLDFLEDIRIKMCIKKDGEDFVTIHHELGHNFYQRAYKDQSIFYKDGANDGFHEAIGDMIALSITPDYLVKIGLLDEADKPSENADLDLLMRQAMDKVAFLPFGLMVDQWRWKVFNGEYTPSEYNDGWWELREKYQGLRAPSERPANAFDPGAKYHIPGNTPYMRYFLAHILQFQFHKAACDMAGFEGPLHQCSIYDNKEVGARFNAMMEMGASKPWPDALEAFTGTRDMDGSAILEYFAPVMTYLQDQNKDRTCGW